MTPPGGNPDPAPGVDRRDVAEETEAEVSGGVDPDRSAGADDDSED